jgi:adenine-specific DNA glycosylase
MIDSQCTAERPKCSGCTKSGVECVYTTTNAAETHSQALKRRYDRLSSKYASLQEVFELLKSRPERESLAILSRIRSGHEVEAILRHVKDGELLLHLNLIPGSHQPDEFSSLMDLSTRVIVPRDPHSDGCLVEATSEKPNNQATITTPEGCPMLNFKPGSHLD